MHHDRPGRRCAFGRGRRRHPTRPPPVAGTQTTSLGACAAIVRSAVDLPLPPDAHDEQPALVRCARRPGRWRCRSGSSARPSSSVSPSRRRRASRSSRSIRAGSAGSHGRRGRGPSAAAVIASRVRARGQRDAHAARRAIAGARARGRGRGRPDAAGQSRRVIGADDRAAVGRIGHPQADPQRAVGEQALAHHARRALGAEHEVHAERAAARRDVGEHRVQLGVLAEQRGELVDDDHEPRQVDARIEDVARPGAGELRLAPAHLGAQALDRPARARAVEVGDHAGDVRHVGERVERGAALEVGEEEAHLARRVRRAQREDPGDEQLGLARPGDTRDDRVRSVRDEIERRRVARLDVRSPRAARPRVARGGSASSGPSATGSDASSSAEQTRRRARPARRRGAPPARCRRPRRRSRGHRRRRRRMPCRRGDGRATTPHPGGRAPDGSARTITMSASAPARLSRRAERERSARRQRADAAALGPRVLAAQRADDPQLARRQAQAQLQDERPHAPPPPAPRCRRPRFPTDAGTTTGASSSRAARARSAAASGSSPPPVTRRALDVARTRRRRRRLAPGRVARSRRRVRRRRRHPDAAPSAAPLVVVALARSSRATRSRATARRGCRASAITASPAGAVEHRRAGDQRAERREPQREHRPGHEPQHDGAENGDDRGQRSARPGSSGGRHGGGSSSGSA